VYNDTFDVFISYGHQDAEWVHTLAANLHRAGLEVFLDAWEIVPGDRIVHQLERGLLSSRNGVLVVSPASMSRPWVQDEYAVMVSRAVQGTQRLIPVLLGDVEIPLFAATRMWVDFRAADGSEYEKRVNQLVAALRGERPTRPPREGELQLPPGPRFRPEGIRQGILQIGPDETAFLAGDKTEVRDRPTGASPRLREQLWRVERARRRGAQAASVALRTVGRDETVGATLHGHLVELGTSLAEAFLPEAVRGALAREVRLATDANAALRLAVEVAAPELADLPWEVLTLAELAAKPLVLHPRVELYRVVAGLGATPAIQIPGPLRVLVVIGSPDQEEGRELLDYENELKRILDAVEPARRQGRAYVRILNRGTVAEMRMALQVQRFHILHVSCHARPGALLLEDENGRPDFVTAERMASEVLVADRGVPLVVLAGCSTALAERAGAVLPAQTTQIGSEPDQGEAALPGLARQMLGFGVPAVLAMNAPVTDPYGARLGARLYQELASQQRPDPLAAVAEARRQVDVELRRAPTGSLEARLAELGEWAIPVLALRGQPLPLFDPSEGFERIQSPPEPRLAHGIVVRGVGDFVGRRREERLLLAELRGERAGVVIHGIGGVGKSTLAARLIHDLSEQAGLVISLSGTVTLDQVLEEVARRLFSASLAMERDEAHPWRQLVRLLRQSKIDWKDRLDALAEHLLRQQPVVLLLDNFEDNLERTSNQEHVFQLADPELAKFLAAWIHAPGMSQLLITSRHPFLLPEGAERRLGIHHLGPLSFAETRKLLWRLPALDSLDVAQQWRAYADVGGHPRTLEYLDALLRGGKARFDDVLERIEHALDSRGVHDRERWLREIKGDLGRAVSEAIALVVDDVLLAELEQLLEAIPFARRLLLGAAVYRQAIEPAALAWQVGEEVPSTEDPERDARWQQIGEVYMSARVRGELSTFEQLGVSQEELEQLVHDMVQRRTPPLRVPEGYERALRVVADLGLVVPTGSSDGDQQLYEMHSWTAYHIERHAAPTEWADAHRRAARYWRWRQQHSASTAIVPWLAARYHFHAAGELDEALNEHEEACRRLSVRGAWSWQERLCLEALTWVPPHSTATAHLTTRLANSALQRGDYRAAEAVGRDALQQWRKLEDRAGLAASCEVLGAVTYEQGRHREAVELYQQALTIYREFKDLSGIARMNHELGSLATARGDLQEATARHREVLAMAEEQGSLEGVAMSCYDLGVVAFEEGNFEAALRWHHRALRDYEELEDRPGISRSYHELGLVAEAQGDLEGALEWHRKALELKEQIGYEAGIAKSYNRLAAIAARQGDLDRALEWHRQALAIHQTVGNTAGVVSTLGQLAEVARGQNDLAAAVEWRRQELEAWLALGYRDSAARTCGHLGRLAEQLDDPGSAGAWYRRSLELAYESGARGIVVSATLLLASLSERQGDNEQASTLYREALIVHDEIGDREGALNTCSRLGALAEELGDDSSAVRYYRRSLKLAKEIGDQFALSVVYNALGLVAARQSRYARSSTLLRASLILSQALGRADNVAANLHQLGIVANYQGALEESAEWFRQSIEVSQEEGNHANVALNYIYIGMVAEKRHDDQEALDCYNRSYELSRDLDDQDGMARAASSAGILATRLALPVLQDDFNPEDLSVEGRMIGDPVGAARLQVEQGARSNLFALLHRIAQGSPDAGIDVIWLRQQRGVLGTERLREIIKEEFTEELCDIVLRILDQAVVGPEDASEVAADRDEAATNASVDDER
jgi:tetratricopeptide (TPR) repeat protein